MEEAIKLEHPRRHKIPDARPHGSLKELKARRISVARYGSCAPHEQNLAGESVVMGCSEHHRCRLPEKTTTKTPCCKGWQEIKSNPTGGQPVIHVHVGYCWEIPGRRDMLENNKGALRVVAAEGQKLRVRGSHIVNRQTADGIKPQIEDCIFEEEVPKFPAIGEEGNLQNLVLASEILEQEYARLETGREREALGMEPLEDVPHEKPAVPKAAR